jgi:hypothetical protein
MELVRGVKIQIPRMARRLEMNWPARYLGPAEQSWTECRVIDLSLRGAALDVPVPADEPHGPLILELQDVDGQPIGLLLRAEVSNWEGQDGRLRLGIAFTGTTSLERYKLAGILSQQRRASKELPNT